VLRRPDALEDAGQATPPTGRHGNITSHANNNSRFDVSEVMAGGHCGNYFNFWLFENSRIMLFLSKDSFKSANFDAV